MLDDVRLRWRSPAYVLEPGDPGYPYDALPPATATRRPRAMKHQACYPTRYADQVVCLENFRNKITATPSPSASRRRTPSWPNAAKSPTSSAPDSARNVDVSIDMGG